MPNGLHRPSPPDQLAPATFNTGAAFRECGGIWTYCAETRDNYWPPHRRNLVQCAIAGEGARWQIICRTASGTTETFSPGPGDIVLIPPECEQEVHWRRRAPLIVLAAEPSLLSEAGMHERTTAERRPLEDFSDLDPLIGVLVASLFAHAATPDAATGRLTAAKGAALFLALARAHARRTGHTVSETEAAHREMRQRVDRYIRAHLTEPFSLKQLAAAAHMSRWHFCRVFKAETSLSPRDYFNRCRVIRAHALLCTGRHTQTQVMHALGFTELGHFRRVFRRHLHVEPRQVIPSLRPK